MNICIVGCGKVGTTIISSLVSEGHDVVVVDSNSEVVSEICNIYDVMGVCGNGVDSDVLLEAGVDKTELFVASTSSDEFNMLSCFIAKKLGAAHTVARIRNPEYNDKSLSFMKQHLDLSMSINPELLTAQELYNILRFPSAIKIETFSRRHFEMIELKLKEDSVLNGMSLIEMRNRFKLNFLVCIVKRGDSVYIPDGSFVLKGGDKIALTAERSELQKLFKSLGIFKKKTHDIMILGGSRISYYLAKMLISSGCNVKIIEKDKEVCEMLCELLPKAVILNGDGASQELLLEEGIQNQDAFVSLTGLDEENILMSYFAESQNVPTVISKVNRDELMPIAEKLSLDCIVSPKNIISDVVVRFARALENSLGSSVEALYKFMDGEVEALEFKVSSDFKYTNIPLKDLSFKKNILVAGIIRNRKPFIPSGNDVILTDDRVIIISAGRKLYDLSDII